jgi:hypothetical protein
MRTRTVVERIGENMGPIDWSYDFRSHFNNYGSSDAHRDEVCKERVEWLRQMDHALKAGRTIEATTDGGWPRCCWGTVLDIGMYDGWPYWKPTPSVYTSGPLGGEWHCFAMITDVRATDRETAGQ